MRAPLILLLSLVSTAFAESLYLVDFESENPGPLEGITSAGFPRQLPSKVSGPKGAVTIETDSSKGGNFLLLRKEPGAENNVLTIFELGKPPVRAELTCSMVFGKGDTSEQRGNVTISGRDGEGGISFNLQLAAGGKVFLNWPDSREEGPELDEREPLAIVLRLHPSTNAYEVEINGKIIFEGTAPRPLEIASLEIASTGQTSRRAFTLDDIKIEATR